MSSSPVGGSSLAKINLVHNEADGVVTPGIADEFGKAILDEHGKTTGISVTMART